MRRQDIPLPIRFVLAILILAASLVVIVAVNRAGRKAGVEEARREAAEPVVATLTSAEPDRAYAANEVAADQRYKGKKVRVTGTVQQIYSDIGKGGTLTLGQAPLFIDVSCSFDEAAPLARLSKGDAVTVVGRCRGKGLSRVSLESCRLE